MSARRSPWLDASASVQRLERDQVADVVVIGAGMAGLLCALELSERGRSVIVLEREAVASGETGSTSAHLTSLLDTRYFALASMHGADAARAVATSHLRGIAHLERVANAYGIECGFRRVSGFLYASNDEQLKELERERLAATEAGISCELVRGAPLAVGARAALHLPHQAEFEPIAFLNGVTAELRRKGVPIYAPVSAQGFDSTSATDQVGITTGDGHSIRANYVVVATDSPVNDVALLHSKQAAYRTYAISAFIEELAPALSWDMEDPYHYLRTAIDAQSKRPVLIVGGEDHRVGQDLDAEQHWTRLEDWLRERFPRAGTIVSQWSGQVLEPSDGLAFIGHNPGQERVLVLTGMSGNGMTYSALGAPLIADLIQGSVNPLRELYDPARKPRSLGAIGRFVRDNLNTAEQYTDWVGPADVTKIEDIHAGEGAVLRRGITRVAVYVDPVGVPHELSATCPHLGGVVAWNNAEKSWDCPCHGSRFDCYGKVLAGPAVSDLAPVPGAAVKVGQAS
jgi:glycine/D-amino acid oxidase-like deaminating enzyme/nitrite reductase/ring-hydroxylating ferredoxin subunit